MPNDFEKFAKEQALAAMPPEFLEAMRQQYMQQNNMDSQQTLREILDERQQPQDVQSTMNQMAASSPWGQMGGQ